jgi:hypothetical protein
METSHILERKIKLYNFKLLEKSNIKQSELKYLSNFRKRNQTRFYN